MDTTTLQRIFDPFFTAKFTGRGLGLASVLGIIQGHHGAIRVESVPEQGTTFTIVLPIVTNPGDCRTSSSYPAASGFVARDLRYSQEYDRVLHDPDRLQ